jgi:hypothetical protein
MKAEGYINAIGSSYNAKVILLKEQKLGNSN